MNRKNSLNVQNSPEPIAHGYLLPFVDKVVSHDAVFGLRGENPLLLRPGDVGRLCGIPAITIYD